MRITENQLRKLIRETLAMSTGAFTPEEVKSLQSFGLRQTVGEEPNVMSKTIGLGDEDEYGQSESEMHVIVEKIPTGYTCGEYDTLNSDETQCKTFDEVMKWLTSR